MGKIVFVALALAIAASTFAEVCTFAEFTVADIGEQVFAMRRALKEALTPKAALSHCCRNELEGRHHPNDHRAKADQQLQIEAALIAGLGRQTAANLLTRDQARRIAANIAKLPDLLRIRARAPLRNRRKRL